jgi:hypothetical protein
MGQLPDVQIGQLPDVQIGQLPGIRISWYPVINIPRSIFKYEISNAGQKILKTGGDLCRIIKDWKIKTQFETLAPKYESSYPGMEVSTLARKFQCFLCSHFKS